MEDSNNKLKKLVEQFTDRSGESGFTEEETEYMTQVKYVISVMLDYPHKLREEQIAMIKQQFNCGRSHAYKLVAAAIELLPSLEKVNKDFERARVKQWIWKFIQMCYDDKNKRDAAYYLKLLVAIDALDDHNEVDGTKKIVVNLLKSAPEELGIEMPADFDLRSFIKFVEKDMHHDKQYSSVEFTEERGE